MGNYETLSKKNEFYSHTVNSTLVNLLDLTFEMPEDFKGALVAVSDEYTARPDLVAMQAYGDESRADLICKINGISNPFEINAGMILVLPDISELEDFAINPSQEWKESESKIPGNTQPVPKKKNEPRQPNEAVIGDSRFNIDPISQIIIY